MASHTFLWHDYETFGINPRRDRPAQFAGIRTDAELNEVGEPLMIYCQPANDYLPDPASCLITGITPQLCLERGIAEHAFAAQIEQVLAEPGTIGVGYNTIRFDDEVTRHLFWRNLMDPYARVAKRLRPLGFARRGAHGLCAAARGYQLAGQGRWQTQLQAGRPGACQWTAA
ncbi:hypothetical protein LP414_30885 [Polaromonas sp. P1(28)-13]|nr:hypothetical protein LP414_30885 [Polaromonas sp. P1(28)-13]